MSAAGEDLAALAQRVRWLQLVAPAALVRAESDRGFHDRAQLVLEDTSSVKFAYLDAAEECGLPLRIYPADTLEQARVFYRDPGRVEKTLAIRDSGWEIRPNFHWGFRERGLCWTQSSLTTDEYATYWVDRIDDTREVRRDEWESELDRLIEDGIFSGADRTQFDLDFTQTRRHRAVPRPGIAAVWYFMLGETHESDFAARVRTVLVQALRALGEPVAILMPKGREDPLFARYRGGGRELLGVPASGDGTSRHGYGPPVLEECGDHCVYCGRALGEPYESWLDFSVDHVIPVGTVQRGYSREWVSDLINLVTACRACNEFLNQYKVDDPPPSDVEEFCVLRDRHLLAKKAWVQTRHQQERARYARWRDGRSP